MTHRSLKLSVALLAATLAVTAAGCGKNSPTSPTPTPPATCAFTVSDGPAASVAATGAEFTVSIATTAGCAWSASSSAAFIAPVGPTNGTGNGTARFAVQSNAGAARQGSVVVAGRTLAISQDAGSPDTCDLAVTPTESSVGKQGGDVPVAVTVTRGNACTWTATSNDPFITVTSGATGTGAGQAVLSVATNTGAARVGTATIAGRTITITQQSGIVATPAAFLSFQSEVGDYIANGQSGTYTLHGSEFQAAIDPGHRMLTFSLPSVATWTLMLSSSITQQLTPGFYDHAIRSPSSSDPAILFLGNGRDCTRVIGRFLVAEAVFGAGNAVERFHARFEHHCEGRSANLTGEIWIDADGSSTPPPMASLPAGPPTPTSFLTLTSDPGDFVGQGQSQTYTLPSALFSPALTNGLPVTYITVMSPSGIFGTPDFRWDLVFAAPSGTQLQTGTYNNAQHYPENPAGSPGLDVSGKFSGASGRGCGSLTGQFVVHEVLYGTFGELYRFHATFEQHCQGGVPALRGEIYIVANPWK